MASPVVISTVTKHGSEFWAYYRRYTDTTVHTAATAGLTIFGLLIFLDPWFAVLAIGSYVLPPVVLYTLSDDRAPGADDGSPQQGRPSDHTARTIDSTRRRSTGGSPRATDGRDTRANPHTVVGNGDTDSDSDDGDTDTDSDSDGTDTDSDSDGTDTDSDNDGTDTDSDSDG
ncbi:hypothetical protein [Haloterrigena alkaliphila]|uniref:Uncharacterized protein n=1 Tax=Haloterrigena alkaliphila TaxID=2816475 RepID=A0A8A2VIN4_9EURY|nr:hypothetical protein [Haloterrigena alkaliphila]QSW98068.1 hypothetical protein J0X25_11665 [Haloterrigena alkaliphila]